VGGWGVEAYFGYSQPHNDLQMETWRSRELWWTYGKYALDFFNALPFDQLNSDDGLVRNGDYCFAKRNDIYVVYHHNSVSATTTIDLSHTSSSIQFSVEWFDTMSGNKSTSPDIINGGAARTYGNAPTRSGKHWAVLLRRVGNSDSIIPAEFGNQGATSPTSNLSNGSSTSVVVVLMVFVCGIFATLALYIRRRQNRLTDIGIDEPEWDDTSIQHTYPPLTDDAEWDNMDIPCDDVVHP